MKNLIKATVVVGGLLWGTVACDAIQDNVEPSINLEDKESVACEREDCPPDPPCDEGC